MESGSPESPSKRRKQHNTRRDPPLFASRRSRPTLQQPPEFLTESINTSRNTSYIPSPVPSPDKSPTRDSFRAKPRQAIDRRGTSRTSGQSTPNVSNENLRPHSSRSPSRLSYTATQGSKSSLLHLATSRAQSHSRSPTRQESIPSMSITPARTPSPPRGRTMVGESPVNSESSPGRGYAEAYQRIVEEENLAQEDSIEDLGLEDDANDREDGSQEQDKSRMGHRLKSTSPLSLHTLRKVSPRVSVVKQPAGEEEEEEEGEGEEEVERETGMNDQESISDLVPAENDTQTSADSASSSQYARDIQRLNSTLKGTGQAFSRARVRQKAGPVSQALRHSSGSDESLGSAFSSEGLSHRSDPSVNIPKAWGRKAKSGKDWLNRINSQSGRFTGDVPKESPSSDQLVAQLEASESERRLPGEINDNEAPLRRTSSLLNGSSRGFKNRTNCQRNAVLERKPQWGLSEDEFTGRSLQVSESPPMRIRNTAQDSAREPKARSWISPARGDDDFGTREEDQESQLLPFEIKRESPGRSLEERFLNGDSATHAVKEGQDWRQETQSKDSNEIPPELGKAPIESAGEEIGEPIPDTPVVVFRNSEDHSQSGRRKQGQQGEPENLLKRLARVSSQSPSPAKEEAGENDNLAKDGKGSKPEQTPHQSRPRLDEKTPVITGAWIEQTPHAIPQTSAPKTTLKTPFVTGGWIETPLPTGGRGPPMPTPSEPENGRELGTTHVGASDLITKLNNTNTPALPARLQDPLKYSGPPLPKSALEEIINDARSGRLKDSRPDLDTAEEPTLNLGESTIQSLEDLIANDTDHSTLLATSQETSPPSSDPSPSSKTNQNPPLEPQDPESYTGLISRLRNLGPSIRASTRQLASLERTVSTTATRSRSLQRPSAAVNNDDECHEAGEFHDFIWPCPRCNCPGRPSTDNSNNISRLIPLTSLTLTIPALWYYPTPTSRLPRLTYLGALAFAIYLYFFLENWAQMTFCHPAYAHSMVGFGVDIHAPRPPFVLFQVLWRKAGLEGVWVWARAVARVVGGVLGWVFQWLVEGFGWGGGEEDGARVVGGGKQPVSRDGRIPRPSWGPDLSMFDDEFL